MRQYRTLTFGNRNVKIYLSLTGTHVVFHFMDFIAPDYANNGIDAIDIAYNKVLNATNMIFPNCTSKHNTSDFGGGISVPAFDSPVLETRFNELYVYCKNNLFF